MKKLSDFIFQAQRFIRSIRKRPFEGIAILVSFLLLSLILLGVFHSRLSSRYILPLNFIGILLLLSPFFPISSKIPRFYLTLFTLIVVIAHLSGGFQRGISGFLYFPLLLIFIENPFWLLSSGIFVFVSEISSFFFRGFPPLPFTILIIFLFYTFILFFTGLQFKQRIKQLKLRLEYLSGQIRFFDHISLQKEEVLKGLKESPFPQEPLQLFKRALNQLIESYRLLLFPQTIAFLFYDRGNRGFRPEAYFSQHSGFVKKEYIPESSPLLKIALKQKKGFYFEEFSGVEETGIYHSRARIGSCVLEPIFQENALYGFIYIDSEKLNAFPKNMKEIAEHLSKEIAILLKFFFEAKKSRIESRRYLALSLLARETAGHIEKKDIYKKILNTSSHIIQYDLGIILENKGEDRAVIALAKDPKGVLKTKEVDLKKDSLVSLAFQNPYPIPAQRIGRNIPIINDENLGLRSGLILPIPIQDTIKFVLCFFSFFPEYFNENDKEVMLRLRDYASLSLGKAELFEYVQEQAKRDGLTGLYNHRMFQELLKEQIKSGKTTSLILFDVDHFKRLNDTYGHPFGDMVLRTIAKILSEGVDKLGFAARYGGEEFALCLDTIAEESMRKAENLRKLIQDWNFYTEEGEKVQVTISGGISFFPEDAKSRSELIDKADKSLYLAKRKGRNRVQVYHPEEVGLI